MSTSKKYCNSLTRYNRLKSREVMVGNVGVGGNNPIRIQSMTTTDTMDTLGTVEQAIRMIEAGCEIVRITAPSKKEAENLVLGIGMLTWTFYNENLRLYVGLNLLKTCRLQRTQKLLQNPLYSKIIITFSTIFSCRSGV